MSKVIKAMSKDKRIPKEWFRSILVPIHKKRSMHEYEKNQGIKLLLHGMKILECIVECILYAKIRKMVESLVKKRTVWH